MNIQDQIAAWINAIDEKQRYAILAGILFSFFLVDYFVLMNPQLAALSKINPQIKILEENLNKAAEDMGKIEVYKKEVERMRVDVGRINQSVRARSELPTLLEHISVTANQSGVVIDQMTPDMEKQKSLLKDGNREYFMLPIQVKLRGNYHDFGRFINRIETGDVYLGMGEFAVVGDGDSARHACRLVLKAVVYEEIVR
ncbi:MAG: type 4a pilus biogenesis protein PilO [Candidatus Omnitrophica bacterium]|nr:type 4a pilus biogenesis protein PilO [Candidatus Omnitrophota bacterium]